MAHIEDLRESEAEREAKEADARRRWESEDMRRLRRDMVDKEFPDDLLEEARRRAAESGR